MNPTYLYFNYTLYSIIHFKAKNVESWMQNFIKQYYRFEKEV